MSRIDPAPVDDVAIVYDGECPVCRSFVLLYRLRSFGGRIHLIDARSDHPLVAEIRYRQLDLDRGMVVQFQGNLFYGADAMHFLALFGSDHTLFNRLNQMIFRRRGLAKALYPALVRARRLLLRLLGRSLIGEVR